MTIDELIQALGQHPPTAHVTLMPSNHTMLRHEEHGRLFLNYDVVRVFEDDQDNSEVFVEFS
jgi:hypothetical protein